MQRMLPESCLKVTVITDKISGVQERWYKLSGHCKSCGQSYRDR